MTQSFLRCCWSARYCQPDASSAKGLHVAKGRNLAERLLLPGLKRTPHTKNLANFQAQPPASQSAKRNRPPESRADDCILRSFRAAVRPEFHQNVLSTSMPQEGLLCGQIEN